MRLAPRLAITFGLLTVASTALLGLAVRARLAEAETKRFQGEVERVCDRMLEEVRRQGDADQKLIAGQCSGGELVDRAVLASNDNVLDERRTMFSVLVPEERQAFDMDELMLAMQGGDIIGAAPRSLLGMSSHDVDVLIGGPSKRFAIRTTGSPALVTRCTKPTESGKVIALIAARNLDPLLDRVGQLTTIDVKVKPSWTRAAPSTPPPATPASGKPGKSGKPAASATASDAAADAGHGKMVRTTCKLEGEGGALTFDVLKSTQELDEKLADVDLSIGIVASIAALITVFVAIILGLRLGRPLSVLANEAGKVVAGEARPLNVRGSGEEKELARAFDRMIQDLAVTRRRLAAASRVAAWREVARRVAHEVKNPLAPIRAAVETLRRLRAREDPRFDEYFDEATRTVLDEVHRIANIVTEFTRFARLPQPRPQELDPEEVLRHVVQLHKAAAGDVDVVLQAPKKPTTLRADRDQVIQVLTNLLQNALDAVKETKSPRVTVAVDADGHYGSFTVTDNGPGIAPDFAARLFEPYATTKAHGTGLGLAIAQRIALEHNGELSYVGPGPDGKGAVFRLLLPIEGPPPMSETPPPPSGDT
jgi:two-component system nitrogen regulation sensor histidine kinase NtrY